MRISLAARVTIACGVVLAGALLILIIGWHVAEQKREANRAVVMLGRALRTEDRHESEQQRLRLAIGEATRKAERGEAVPAWQWQALSSQLDAYVALPTAPPLRSPAIRPLESATRATELAFAGQARRLLALAQAEPDRIETTMPGFLAVLKRLEGSQIRLREALAHEIGDIAGENERVGHRNTVIVFALAVANVSFFLWMAVWLRRRLLSPVQLIAARLRDFNAGDDSGTLPALDRRDELGDLARGLERYRTAVAQRRAAEQRAEFLAHHDMLTGLPNRLLFEDRLEALLAEARQSGDSIALFAIDLDGFKSINDRLGHAGGDQALRRAGQLLLSCTRPDDVVARLGGDEFAILQVSNCQPDAAQALLARLLEACAATEREPLSIRMSVGVALSTPEQSGDELHTLADLALYRAKADGRNTGRFFDAGLRAHETMRLRLARDLETAVAEDALTLAFQPIADASTLHVIGQEALLRWRHPTLGDIPPETFIPVAEANGLIEAIGLWVADRAMAAAAQWRPSLTLALNLSPVQFRAPDIAADLLALAERHGISPSRLEFEVTESATLFGAHREAVLHGLRRLQEQGARIVMDDFGTGHSSLSNLKDFTFDKLKIDRSFVAAMGEHRSSASIVKATIGLGQSMGLTIVAEGVETQAQLATLRRWGCDQVQGYLIGRPELTSLPRGRRVPGAARLGGYGPTRAVTSRR